MSSRSDVESKQRESFTADNRTTQMRSEDLFPRKQSKDIQKQSARVPLGVSLGVPFGVSEMDQNDNILERVTEIKWNELREMDEEEQYIERLREQRKKINEIKGEFVMKVDYYNGLEEKIRELGKYKPYFTKYNELRAIMEQLLEKLSYSEDQANGWRSTVSEYTSLIKELQEKLVDCKRDNLKLLEEIEQKKIQNNQMKMQMKNMSQQISDVQNQLKIQKEKFDTIDLMWKEQMSQTKIENIKLQENLMQFKSLNEQIIHLRNGKEELTLTNKKLQLEIKELGDERNSLKEEKSLITKELESKNSQIDDIRVKFSELEYNQIMINAKNTNEEQHSRNQSNNQLSFRQILREREDELSRSRNLNQQLSVEYDSAVKKIKEFEQEIWEYRKENHSLKVKLSSLGNMIPNHQLIKNELDQLEKDIFGSKKLGPQSNGMKHTENGMKQTENNSKYTENSMKQTENNSKYTENGNKYTENGSRLTENGNKHTENGSKHSLQFRKMIDSEDIPNHGAFLQLPTFDFPTNLQTEP